THQARHDTDTDLPNRLALEEAIGDFLRTSQDIVSVVALGIERFAYLRSAIGYPKVAALIHEVAERIERLYPECKVARLNSDALGLTFTAETIEDARVFISMVLDSLDRPFSIDGDTIDVAFACGLAYRHEHPERAAQLIEQSSIALDQAR